MGPCRGSRWVLVGAVGGSLYGRWAGPCKGSGRVLVGAVGGSL